MATILFAAAGAAVGGQIGGTILGVGAAAIGQAVGGAVGGLVDNAILGAFTPATKSEGPRLDSLTVASGLGGKPIPRGFGRFRITTGPMWASRFAETKTTENVGGKDGVLGIGASPGVDVTNYAYTVNVAFPILDGRIGGIADVYFDGNRIDLEAFDYELKRGFEGQDPSAYIEEIEGEWAAYPGLAYIVFRNLPLAGVGGRIPTFSCEVIAPIPGEVEDDVLGVNLIPGSTEFGYLPRVVTREDVGETENANHVATRSDWAVSLDRLGATLRNVETVSLVVTWFGTDLRLGQCEIVPKVDNGSKETSPEVWRVDGLSRDEVEVVSEVDGHPAYGGTPSDVSVVEAIQDLKARGYRVTLYPFVAMDIQAADELPDPDGVGDQGSYPWRGRIRAGTRDKSADARSDVETFFGRTWGFRRFILHLAELGAQAGLGDGDAFLIGSEMVGLTRTRDGSGAYPATEALVDLAGDARAILGADVAISYAADWSELCAWQTGDGSGDVLFPLDDLWSDAEIDFVGVDYYVPLSDWREGRDHLDAALASDVHDVNYLTSQIEGGEGFDYYYASTADRRDQVRTPIDDTAHGEDWVFRYKDLRAWRSNAHHERPGGVRNASPTSWVPSSKKIVLTEYGCPAVDKGTNQPNVFVDPKSVESSLPHFSTGAADPALQRAYLEAVVGWLAEHGSAFDVSRSCVWCWDARPIPEFPFSETWADADNWTFGHWVNARLGTAPVKRTLEKLAAEYGVDVEVDASPAVVAGFYLDATLSFRDAVKSLASVAFMDAVETDGKVRFRSRRNLAPVASFASEDLVPVSGDRASVITRAPDLDLPLRFRFSFRGEEDFDVAEVSSEDALGPRENVADVSLGLVMGAHLAKGIVDLTAAESEVSRETISFALPLSTLAVEAGDVVGIDGDEWRILAISDGPVRQTKATRYAASIFRSAPSPRRRRRSGPPKPPIPPKLIAADLPVLPWLYGGDGSGWLLPYSATGLGVFSLFAGDDEDGFDYLGPISAKGTSGRLLDPLPAVVDPPEVWDHATSVRVKLRRGSLVSKGRRQVLAGGNALAVRVASGAWEVVHFLTAELQGDGSFLISGLLRGQEGTEPAAEEGAAADADVIVLDEDVLRLAVGVDGIDEERDFYAVRSKVDIPAATPTTHAFAGRDLVPWRPAHLAVASDGSGGLAISWVRRTRIDGDSWGAAEVPLGEASEVYEVTISGGGAEDRVFEVTSPAATYSAAEIAADMRSGATTISVAQVSAVVGPGDPATISVTL